MKALEPPDSKAFLFAAGYIRGSDQMLHKMDLWHDSFEKIRGKTKTIEMRLNDEKRRSIRPGDVIEFTDISDGRKVQCSVLELFRYTSFEELYLHHDKQSIGYAENEEAKPSDMLNYYSGEDIARYGVVGIKVSVM